MSRECLSSEFKILISSSILFYLREYSCCCCSIWSCLLINTYFILDSWFSQISILDIWDLFKFYILLWFSLAMSSFNLMISSLCCSSRISIYSVNILTCSIRVSICFYFNSNYYLTSINILFFYCSINIRPLYSSCNCCSSLPYKICNWCYFYLRS